ncbi:EAL and HDOD domain-containing protein [Thiorhodospira sibirica]|uniref:EAL and HDOD domain-containing protein n=1 Tax=Thiorhodospira sibirica TaxID=154347 RepID=UPI000307FBBE|nr:HDOD domain-containing protein [Thiorhodospira sibirica]
MTDVFIARQPIYDRAGDVYAYELLFRETEADQNANILDGDQASCHLILQAMTAVGLNVLAEQQLAFINVTHNLLASGVLNTLPKQRVVLEVLENVVADEPILQAVAQLSREGFKIALDDWVYEVNNAAFLDLADIVKLEVQNKSKNELLAQLRYLSPTGTQLLAEKIENQTQHDLCIELGFSYFQGYHLARPVICRGKTIPPNRLSLMRLMAQFQDSELNLEELQRLISLDISISYQLLRLINSAFFGLGRKVDSVRHAVTLLGTEAIRKWVTLLTLAGINEQPTVLIKEAFVRARMCELLARHTGQQGSEKYFMVGLFSVLDQLLQIPMPEILEELPLAQDITDALLEHKGSMGEALSCVILFESGTIDQCRHFAQLNEHHTSQLYFESLNWAHAFIEEMGVDIS